MSKAISRSLLGKIVDEVFGGAIEDSSVIEEIYAVIRREEAALSAAEPQPAPPEGWQLVPVEPTEEMVKAGRKEAADCDDTYGSSLFSAAEIYRAMLAAAPAKQEGGG